MQYLHNAKAPATRGRWRAARGLTRQRYSKGRPVDPPPGTSAKSRRLDLHQSANRSVDLEREGIPRPPRNGPPEWPRRLDLGARAQNGAREQPRECSRPFGEVSAQPGPLTRYRQFPRFVRGQLSGARRQRLSVRTLSRGGLSKTDQCDRTWDGVELTPLQHSKSATLPALGSLRGSHAVTLAGCEPERQSRAPNNR